MVYVLVRFGFFFKQETAYEMRISDWSSDVCSSDLLTAAIASRLAPTGIGGDHKYCLHHGSLWEQLSWMIYLAIVSRDSKPPTAPGHAKSEGVSVIALDRKSVV